MKKSSYTLEFLESSWKDGILLNPFIYINEHGEDAIPAVVNSFLSNTNGYGRLGSDSFLQAESLFIQSLLYYLFWEAPYEEMNLCMVAELLGTADINAFDDEYQSDLDLLFNHL